MGIARAYSVGDYVEINSPEGFGGAAVIIERRTSDQSHFKVAMVDGSQPAFWAWNWEIVPPDYDSRPDTYSHIQQVQEFLGKAVVNLMARAAKHDQSKLHGVELHMFDKFTPQLAGSTYDSDEYKGFLAAMKPALDCHYAANDHHPEHYPPVENNRTRELRRMLTHLHGVEANACPHTDAEGYLNAKGLRQYVEQKLAEAESRTNGMTLLSMLEMLCDWKAATMRHNDGNLARSIEVNQARFGYSDDMKEILLNTARELDLI